MFYNSIMYNFLLQTNVQSVTEVSLKMRNAGQQLMMIILGFCFGFFCGFWGGFWELKEEKLSCIVWTSCKMFFASQY